METALAITAGLSVELILRAIAAFETKAVVAAEPVTAEAETVDMDMDMDTDTDVGMDYHSAMERYDCLHTPDNGAWIESY